MGRIRTFEIVVDDNGLSQVDGIPVYRPGNHVTGVVHLTLNVARDDVKEISIKLQGRAKTIWSEVLGSRSNVLANQTVTFTGTETYIDAKISLWQQAHPQQKLNRGPYAFAFQFQVPLENLPTAYEVTNGYVRYRLMCEISGDSSLSYTKVTKTIAIAGRPLDLNCVQSAMLPIHGDSESLLTSLCCITGSIKIQASADKRAYVPGETAYITAIVHGSSGTRYDVILKLVEEASLRGTGSVFTSPGVSVARTGTCQRCRVITRKKTSGVLQRRGETTLQREPMVIPTDRPIPDSGFQGCSIIDVSYFISVAPVISRFRRSEETEVRLPITIGRVPFRALPPYHATMAHMGHPIEPPPSYEMVTSFRQAEARDTSNIAFVNQAYSPAIEENTPTEPRDQGELIVSLPPEASGMHDDVDSHQSDLNNEQRQLSGDEHERRLDPAQTPPVESPGILPEADADVGGFVNPSFSSDARDENGALSQDGGSEQAVEEHPSVDAVGQQETLAPVEDVEHQLPLPPPPLFFAPDAEIGAGTPVNANQENRAHRVSLTRGLSHEDRRDRTASQDSGTVAYFLPAYESQLLGRVSTEDSIDQEVEATEVRLQSFFLPIHQDSDSPGLQDAELLDDPEETNGETLPPPSPWKDEESVQEDEIATPPEDNAQVPVEVEEKEVTVSSSQDQEVVPPVIRTHAWEEYVSLGRNMENTSHDNELTTFKASHSISQKSKKSPVHEDANRIAPSSEFGNGSSPESIKATLENWVKRKERPTSLSLFLGNGQSSPLSPSKESLFGNVRLVHDSPRQESRTPSPYFHPDDGRGDREDVSSVSSFGSYSPSTARAPRERRRSRTPDDEKRNRARSADPGRGREIRTLPRSRSSSRGLRESALGSLDRRGRVLRHSSSHSLSSQDVSGSHPDSLSGSRKGGDSAFDPQSRADSKRVQHTVSLPLMDWYNTKSAAYQRLATKLDADDVSRPRKQTKSDLRISDKTKLLSQPSQETLTSTDQPHGSYDNENITGTYITLPTTREDSFRKRLSYISAVENPKDKKPEGPPRERREISSAPSRRQHLWESVAKDARPKKMKPCLAYADQGVDEEDDGLDKQRLETFV